MKSYIIKRLLQLIPILLGLSLLTFSLLYLAPGDAAQKKLTAKGIAVTEELIEQEREALGLNQPFWKQYKSWLLSVLHGDLGTSYKDGLPVLGKLAESMGHTLILTICSMVFALVIAVPLGVLAAVRQNRFSDYLIRFLSLFGDSIPNFLFAVLLMYFFCIRVNWFPVIARGSLAGLFLPVLSLSIPLIGRFVRQVRTEMLEQLSKEYISGARSRGVKEGIILYANALHNCMISLVTIIGLSLGTLLGGSVVTETIFGWPGIGKLVMDAITNRDLPVIQGYVLIIAVIYVVVNLITDISYRRLDPRVER